MTLKILAKLNMQIIKSDISKWEQLQPRPKRTATGAVGVPSCYWKNVTVG